MDSTTVPHPSLSEKAYILIRDKILKGELPLGAPLSRRKLAADFEMSFVPVSEALRRLENEGFVESKPRVGTRVRVPNPQDLRNCYIVREALESQAARLFSEKASPDERTELLAMADRLEQLIQAEVGQEVDRGRQFSIQALHLDFHVRIVECTGCTLLAELIENKNLLVYNWFFDMAAGSEFAPGGHRELAKVIVGYDPDSAMLAMARHVRSGLEEIETAITDRSTAIPTDIRQGPKRRGNQPWRLPQNRDAR